ncbi:MAG TPA: BPSS1780 family membrane protein [Burkholderiales bacterium]|nr:BPSS1780 family membrane protein [Burkholderiales bacterium]
MEARALEASRGWRWIVDGFELFRRSPLVWIVLTLVMVLLWMASLMIPVLGPLLFNLLSPVLFAGLMIGCRALERGEPLEIGHLFAGFRDQAAALVTVGGVYLVGTIVVLGLVFVSAGGSMMPAVMPKPGTDLEIVGAAARSLALAFAVGAAAYVPLLMLVWFAPPLIVFQRMAPVDAMKLSFGACWKNVLPFLVYGAAALALWIIASIPFLLGLIVLVPVLICSVYASYRDVFAARAAPAAGNPFLR